MSVTLYGSPAGTTSLPGIRTILVPPDVVAVTRRAPPVRKKPPCRRRPEGEPIERTGGRRWLDDRLFIEPQRDRIRSGLGGSIGVHALVVTVVLGLAAQFQHGPLPKVQSRLVVPAALLMPPMGGAQSRAPESVKHPLGASRPAERDPAPTLAPAEIPSSIEPETGEDGSAAGVEAVAEGGGAGGIEGGGIGEGPGGPAGSSGTSSFGPLRPGNTFAPPRKIKDVRPVYPPLARALQARGTVIIEITIGTDGKVRETTVIHSVPALDQAALDAVRQWEYEPTRVNGALVAFIMTVVVNFAVQ